MIGLSILMILCLVFKLTYISPFIKTQKENSAFIILPCNVLPILHIAFFVVKNDSSNGRAVVIIKKISSYLVDFNGFMYFCNRNHKKRRLFC